jgi:uncharacterized damage-inducible protein DinB
LLSGELRDQKNRAAKITDSFKKVWVNNDACCKFCPKKKFAPAKPAAIGLSLTHLFFVLSIKYITMTHNDLTTETLDATVLTPDALLKHWQGHRGLTRKMIEAFPEEKLFTYSVGGMRPFADLVYEFLGMAVPGISGIATGKWEKWADAGKVTTKKDLLALWDKATADIDRIWATIPPHRFAEEDVAFGQWPGTGISFIFYFIDNEIHHRGQGYVYLRSLGIEPPAFWDRQ